VVSLVSYAGNLGMNSGQPQSVYQLNTSHLRRLPIAPKPLAPGASMRLPDGAVTLTFTGYKQWISLEITYDPGQTPALISGLAALAGLILSFMVRRRRMFVRAYADHDGTTVVDVAGLARSDAAGGFETEFAVLAGELGQAQGGRPHANTAAASGPPEASRTDLLPDGNSPGTADPAIGEDYDGPSSARANHSPSQADDYQDHDPSLADQERE